MIKKELVKHVLDQEAKDLSEEAQSLILLAEHHDELDPARAAGYRATAQGMEQGAHRLFIMSGLLS
jgi:hypothetical protein